MKSFARHPLNLPYAETYLPFVFAIMLTDICFIKIGFLYYPCHATPIQTMHA